MAAADRPNLLLVLTDQQRPDWVGSDPDVPVRTPNLDALGRSGTHFTRAVCPAPLCAPSRSCLAAGTAYDRSPVRRNHDYPADRETLYGRLRDEAGYHTVGVGDLDLHMDSPTWGLTGDAALPDLGFSEGTEIPGKRAMVRTCRTDFEETGGADQLPPGVDPDAGEPADPYLAHLKDRGLLETDVEDMTDRLYGDGPHSSFATTRPAPLPEDAYVDNWVGRQALDALAAAPTDEPWHLAVNFVGPHEPMDVTEAMHGWYRDPDVEFPAPVDPAGDLDPGTHQAIRRNYAAICENVDRWLGAFLDALDRRGEREETVVVFASDHGELLGDHGGWKKKSPRRASAGVPLVVDGPGTASRGRVKEPASLLDIHATFLDYGGLDQGAAGGRSLRPYLAGETDDHRDVVRSGLDPRGSEPWWLVSDGRYDLIACEDLSTVNGFDEDATAPVLFDVDADPRERTDLADATPAVRGRLAAHLPDAAGVR